MALADLAAEHDAMLREQVFRETFGHLDAKPGVAYRGHIVFAESAFADPGVVVLASEFGEAGYGPWFYEAIHEWLDWQDVEPGRLYRWEGHYMLTTTGVHQFIGGVVEERDV